MKKLERLSPCKINLLLNVLGKRADGFHELETVMHPLKIADRLEFEPAAAGIELRCNHPELPCDAGNLVYRAAALFFERLGHPAGVRITLEKNVPLAAGLGGGSSNAAQTLAGLNELFDAPFSRDQLAGMAAGLGSDIPFFLYDSAAIAFGRGERIEPIAQLPALRGAFVVLVHPGFGVPTAWAYKELAKFPEALNGRPGRAQALVAKLRSDDLRSARTEFYNSLEAPVLKKYPVLQLYLETFFENGAAAALMSGSGSSTFALVESQEAAEKIAQAFRKRFGESAWLAITPLA